MRPMLGLLINGLYVEQIVISDGAEKVVSAHSMYSKYLRQEQFFVFFQLPFMQIGMHLISSRKRKFA